MVECFLFLCHLLKFVAIFQFWLKPFNNNGFFLQEAVLSILPSYLAKQNARNKAVEKTAARTYFLQVL